jgi:hypothetical protein
VNGWRSLLNKDPTDWLLEKNNPSVRYLTLTQLLEKDENESDVIEAKSAISEYTSVKRIFSKQREEGYWENSNTPYVPKYKSTCWQIMILSQLGLSKENEKVRKACEFAFRFQCKDGGFTVFKEEGAMNEYSWWKKRQEEKGKPVPPFNNWSKGIIKENELTCLTGNLVASFLRLGYKEDFRIKKAIQWLISVQNSDGGWLCPYWRAHINDKHSCFVGTIASLDALSEIPENQRTDEMKKCIEKGAEFFLMHHLYKADHHNFEVINPYCLNFNFPVFWYDILRGLLVLTKLGYARDERIQDATNILFKKQTKDGRWNLDKTPGGRMHASFGKVGEPNKWVTLNVLRVLRRIYQ